MPMWYCISKERQERELEAARSSQTKIRGPYENERGEIEIPSPRDYRSLNILDQEPNKPFDLPRRYGKLVGLEPK